METSIHILPRKREQFEDELKKKNKELLSSSLPPYPRILIHSPKPEYILESDGMEQKYYIPGRSVPVVRKGIDLIILPGGSADVKEFWDFCQEKLQLEPWQVYWTRGSSYRMEEDLTEEDCKAITSTIKSKSSKYQQYGKTLLMPYSVMRETTQIAPVMSSILYGDRPEFAENFTKAYLKKLNVPVPRGQECSTKEELREAVRALQKLKGEVRGIVLKPVFGTSGEGIRFLTFENALAEVEKYDFASGPAIIEEEMDVDRDENNDPISICIHMCGPNMIGGICDQVLLHGKKYSGFIYPCSSSAEFQRQCKAIVTEIYDKLKPSGTWGIDILSVKGKPYVVDLNPGRFNGSHYAKMFTEFYAPKAAACGNFTVPSTLSARQLFELLQIDGIAFDPSTQSTNDIPYGVFPIGQMKGLHGGIVVYGNNVEDVKKLYTRTMQLIQNL